MVDVNSQREIEYLQGNLRKLGINYFSHNLLYKTQEGTITLLKNYFSDEIWKKSFVENRYYKKDMVDYKIYKGLDDIFEWRHLPCNPQQKKIMEERENKFNHFHGLTIIRNIDDFVTTMSIASCTVNSPTFNIYLNNSPLFLIYMDKMSGVLSRTFTN